MIERFLQERGLVRKQQSRIIPAIVEAVSTGSFSALTSSSLDDKAFLEAYQSVSWIYIAINAIAQNAASVPLRFFRVSPEGDETEILPSDDQRARVFKRPFSTFLSFFQLIEWSMVSLHATGKIFWEVQPNFKNPQFIFPIRADLIEPVPDPRLYIKGYNFKFKGRTTMLDPDNVFYVRNMHPTDDFDGLSPLAAGSLAAATDLMATKMNIALLKNQNRPQGVYTAKEELSDESFERMDRQIRADHSGVSSVGKPLLLEAGADYKAVQLPPKEMEYIRGREFTRDELLALLRVPPTVAGVPSANFATARIEERRFWTQAIMPALSQLAWAIDTMFFPEEDIVTRFDFSNIAALQEEETEKENRLKGRFAAGIISTNEYREEVGLDPVRDGDQRFMPANLIPVGTTEPQEAPPPTPVLPPEEEALPLLVSKAADIVTGFIDAEFETVPARKELSNIEYQERRRTALWKQKDLDRKSEERSFAEHLVVLFRRQQIRIKRSVRDFVADNPGTLVPLHIAFDDEQEDEVFREMGVRLMASTYLEFARRGMDLAEDLGAAKQFEAGLAFDLIDEDARKFLLEKAFKFAGAVNDVTKERLRGALLEGFDAGEGVGELSIRVSDVFAGTERAEGFRATRIARTEMAGIGGRGTMDGYRAIGTTQHEWLSARDSDVRDTHQIDGEKVTIGTQFSNGLLHPGDPGGDAGEVINCRCDTLPVVKASGRTV